jgi:predicted regulator of Ras-like GTPase activity (Roadblock/LC7/MglB family)
MSVAIEVETDTSVTVNEILSSLLAYDEILGVVAVNVEGLVMGTAGLFDADIDLVSLLGASLVGVAERSTRRLGAGSAIGMNIMTGSGMITLRNGGDFALMVFTAPSDSSALHEVLTTPMAQIAQILNPV